MPPPEPDLYTEPHAPQPVEPAIETVSAAPAPQPAPTCRPYTAQSSVTGLNEPVRGLACRLPDGRWRLVSEVPDR